MPQRQSRLRTGATILLLSCLLAFGLALLQGGTKLVAHDGETGFRGMLLAALGAIVAFVDLAGIWKFISQPRQDD